MAVDSLKQLYPGNLVPAFGIVLKPGHGTSISRLTGCASLGASPVHPTDANPGVAPWAQGERSSASDSSGQ